MEDIVIGNQEKLEEIKKSISQAGAKRMHVLADFDRTLTKAHVDGKNMPSIMAILRDGSYLTPDYAKKAQELYDKYHPFEVDLKISIGDKKNAMHKWWTEHFDLVIRSGLNKKDIEKVVETGKIRFRQGFNDFIDILRLNNIPLVIMSSSGLGRDAISMCFEKEKASYNNIHIISNSYIWDEKGNAISVKEPIIHAMNKDETVIKDFPVYELIKERKNVLLLGDNLEDIGMIQGFDYENLIKIGFLNEKVEENLETYKTNYDIVVLNDSSFNYINNLLNELINN